MPPNPEPKPPTEEDIRFITAFDALLQRMNPQHAELVLKEYVQWMRTGAKADWSNLLSAVIDFVTGHLERREPRWNCLLRSPPFTFSIP
jgi:hypothetical protein